MKKQTKQQKHTKKLYFSWSGKAKDLKFLLSLKK